MIFLSAHISGQAQTEQELDQLGTIVDTLYDVISGPKGERAWDKFRSLFHATARMGAIVKNGAGELVFFSLTPEEYIERNGPFFKKSDFFEEELVRQVNIFGGVAQVFTSYQFRLGLEGPPEQRGINCIHLVQEKGRWWIRDIIWQAETETLKLPSEMEGIKKKK